MADHNAMERHTGATTQMERSRPNTVYVPDVDVLETAEALILVADMPGSKSDEIDVRYENGELTIHGRVAERQPEGSKPLLREYGVGHFNRVFQLSEQIDAGRISAEYTHGVLTVRLPKVEAAKPRTIKVVSRN